MSISAVGPQVLGTKVTRPAWSMTGKSPPRRPPDGPGVGAYEAPSSLGKQVTSAAPTSPSVSFPHSPRKAPLLSTAPGPGTYSAPAAFGAQPKSNKTTAPSWTMNGRMDKADSRRANPGPGDYEAVSSMGRQPTRPSAPQYTMLGRPAARPLDDLPGPGEHEAAVPATGKQPLSNRVTAPGYSLGARRFQRDADVADKHGPGVCRTDGAFGKQPYSVKRSAPTFSFGARTAGDALATNAKNPGPGAHEIRPMATGQQIDSRVPSAPAYSLGVRRPVLHDRSAPGPGTYEADTAVGKQLTSSRHTAPAYQFGVSSTRHRSRTPSAGPGPGAYEQLDTIAKRARERAMTLRGREKFGSHVTGSIAPGPGAYSSPRARRTARRAAPAYSFPGSARDVKYTSLSPGPGAYSAERPSSTPGITMKARRPIVKRQWEREGPGRCREASMFGRQSDSSKRSHGGFSFGRRTKTRAADSTPGPGAYQSFSRGVLSVPMGRKLNLTGERTKRRRRRRKGRRGKASQSRGASHTASATRSQRASTEGMDEPSGYY